jgi:HEPN domain-containing protein
MKTLTREWVDKAEADFATAQRELIVPSNANYDAVCFHSQQCAEKFLKARLQEADIVFRKTHDLSVLLDLVVSVEPSWENLRSELDPLTAYAVDYRYPGQSSEQFEASVALEACQTVRSVVRAALGLEVDRDEDSERP